MFIKSHLYLGNCEIGHRRVINGNARILRIYFRCKHILLFCEASIIEHVAERFDVFEFRRQPRANNVVGTCHTLNAI